MTIKSVVSTLEHAAETGLKDIVSLSEDLAKVAIDPVVAKDVIYIVQDSVAIAAEAPAGNPTVLTEDSLKIAEAASSLLTEAEKDIGLNSVGLSVDLTPKSFN